VPHLGSRGAYLKQEMQDKLIKHKHYIDIHGEDLPEIRNWKWGSFAGQEPAADLSPDRIPKPNNL
jgi:hypothetical protein